MDSYGGGLGLCFCSSDIQLIRPVSGSNAENHGIQFGLIERGATMSILIRVKEVN